MSPLFYLAAFAVFTLVAGCGYAAKFGLSGKSVKYDERLTGDFVSGDTKLSIKKIDDYRVHVDYFKPDELDDEKVKGVGRFVMLGDKLFAEVKEDDVYYIVKVLAVSGKTININILDTEDMPENTEFSSTDDFTHFVQHEQGLFSKSFNRKFQRR